jgi:hypothetical protein
MRIIVLPGGSSPRPPFSRFARRAAAGTAPSLPGLEGFPAEKKVISRLYDSRWMGDQWEIIPMSGKVVPHGLTCEIAS